MSLLALYVLHLAALQMEWSDRVYSGIYKMFPEKFPVFLIYQQIPTTITVLFWASLVVGFVCDGSRISRM